jgi:hypothetical protein
MNLDELLKLYPEGEVRSEIKDSILKDAKEESENSLEELENKLNLHRINKESGENAAIEEAWKDGVVSSDRSEIRMRYVLKRVHNEVETTYEEAIKLKRQTSST